MSHQYPSGSCVLNHLNLVCVMRHVRAPYWAGIFCLWLYKCHVRQGFLWQLTLPGGSSVETWGLHKRHFLHYRTGSSIASPWRRWLPGTCWVQPFPVWCCIWYNWIWLVFWLLWPWGVCICQGGTPSDLSGSIPRVYWGPLGKRSLRKSSIQVRFLPRIPYLLSFVRSLPCDTLSKALLKSITMQSTCLWAESIVWRLWLSSTWISPSF